MDAKTREALEQIVKIGKVEAFDIQARDQMLSWARTALKEREEAIQYQQRLPLTDSEAEALNLESDPVLKLRHLVARIEAISAEIDERVDQKIPLTIPEMQGIVSMNDSTLIKLGLG